ncbi:MAG: hypothetical protein RLZZ15_4313 [Verrucomicrobiota bacterium]
MARLGAADLEVTTDKAHAGHRARTLLAKPRAGVVLPPDAVSAAERDARLTFVRSHPRLGGIRTLATDGTADVLEVVKRLAATGAYDYVEPDYLR